MKIKIHNFLQKALVKTALFVCLCIFIFVVAGCGSGSAKPSTAQLGAFDGAPDEVKQAWKKALDAEQASDYVGAQTSFESLSKLDLAPQQKQALDSEFFSFQDRLYQAAEKGNQEAIKAMQDIRKNGNRS
jgi:hypothetical protein